MIYGVLMVLVVYFLPEGIVPAVRNWWQRRARRSGRCRAGAPDRGGRAMSAQRRHRARRRGPHRSASAASPPSTASTFEVREGEVLSLIGPNGAGKTTAFNAITGYIEPAGGDITYRGQRLNGLKPNADRRARRGAHVPEDQRVRRARPCTTTC